MRKSSNSLQFLRIMVATFLILRPQAIISAYPSSVMVFSFIQLFIIIWIFILNKFQFKLNIFLKSIIAFYIYDLINTVHQKTASPNLVFVTGVWVLFSVIIISHYISMLGIQKALYLFSVCLTVYLWIECILILFFPQGIISVIGGTGRYKDIFLFGQTNQLSIIFVMSTIIVVCNEVIQEKVTLHYVFLSLSVWPISAFLMGENNKSTTGLIGGFVLIIGYCFYKLAPLIVKRIANPYFITFIIIGIFMGITKILSIESVSNFIKYKLNKDVTLSERTTIWTQSYEVLKDTKILLFGMGEASGGAYITIWSGHTFSAHNILIQILLLGGIVLLSIFSIPVISTIKSIALIGSNKSKVPLSICLFVFFLINMLEVYYYSMFFLTLYVIYETSTFISNDYDKETDTYKTLIRREQHL